MNFQAVKGTRDFYPQEMRVRNWIVEAWRRVSLRNGFEEYDAPIFEYLDLYTAKSGDEIVSQLFAFEDRGGRKLAIRPEMTPSLARMVNGRINSLPRPIKWFSVPRMCRAENPQKGRLREFFQWNIDIIGSDDVAADAECIFVLADFFREVGLCGDDVVIRIGSRPLSVAALQIAGVADATIDKALPVLDKRPKVSLEEFRKLAADAGLTGEQTDFVIRFQDCTDTEQVVELLGGRADVVEQAAKLRTLMEYARSMGVGEFCQLDMRMVRGLAYYTGIVYEGFDKGQSLRACAGGGRYDNLLEVLGGPKVGACGFGMGDVVVGILLEEKGKLPAHLSAAALDFFVIDSGEGLLDTVMQVVGALRGKGISADFSYKRQNIGKQLKAANQRGARLAAIVGPGGVAVKDLASGSQLAEVSLAEFLANPLGPRV